MKKSEKVCETTKENWGLMKSAKMCEVRLEYGKLTEGKSCVTFWDSVKNGDLLKKCWGMMEGKWEVT